MTVLEVRGLEKHFGGLPAVDGVDLEVEADQVCAVIGPNGAGKSTLLATISGLLVPSTRSCIRFEGADIVGLEPHEIRRRGIAHVLQTPRVFTTMTLRENVALGAMFGRGDVRVGERAALDVASGLLERLGLGSRSGSEVGVLTLHERRLVELARALAGRPRLLLLDEVMAGLDPAELDASLGLLREVRDELGVSVIWVEHVMRAVTAVADRVVVLHVGRKLAEGPPQVVMRDEAVMEAYLGRRPEEPC